MQIGVIIVLCSVLDGQCQEISLPPVSSVQECEYKGQIAASQMIQDGQILDSIRCRIGAGEAQGQG